MKINEKLDKGWLQVHILFEIIGRPKEHITEILHAVVKKLGEEQNLEIIKHKVHEAKQLPKSEKEAQEVFSNFAEIEILVRNITKLVEIVFDYMPSSVEIVFPNDLKMNLSDANALLNDLATKLHQYNMFTKAIQTERDILASKLSDITKKMEKKS